MNLLEGLARFVREIDIDTVFGLPGIHNLDFFNAFQKAGFKVFTAVHEQGAAFMADGYARSTGKAAVCLVIDGPGFLNAATAIAQAHADSVPMLVVSPVHRHNVSVNGRLHELHNQEAIATQICEKSYDLTGAMEANEIFDDIAYRFFNGRHRPLHVQVPLAETDTPFPSNHTVKVNASATPKFTSGDVNAAADLLNSAGNPMVVVGGGSVAATHEVKETIELLDAPCVNTVNGKGVLPPNHYLHVGGSPSIPAIQQALYNADAILALGTEFGETDFGLFLEHPFKPLNNLVRVDIDSDQLNKNQTPSVGLCGPTKTILPNLELKPRTRNGKTRTQAIRQAFQKDRYVSDEYREFLDCLMVNSDVVVGDSCQPTYHASWSIEPVEPRSYFHSVTGFGTLGYALPASIGAKIANPQKRVVSLIGDGGLLYTLTEIHSALRYRLSLPIVVWNNNGYNEIEKATSAVQSEFQCPAMDALDYEKIALGFKISYAAPSDLDSLRTALLLAQDQTKPTLLHLNQADFIKSEIGNWYE